DGTRLALAADAGLFVVDRDGRNARTVNHGLFKEFGSRGEAAEWSPEGTALLFTAIDPFDLQDVFVLTLDGSAERNVSGPTLLARREAGDPTGIRARDASYSPDGTRMAYMRTGFGDGPICVIADSDGDRSMPLAGAYGWYQPIWSPDGTKVVVTDDRPGPDNNEALPAVRVILDVAGSQPPIEIPAPGSSGESIPDWAATWQRVAP
ncbi:MAG: TolB family protein, partial [Chloroflexota bacterium]